MHPALLAHKAPIVNKERLNIFGSPPIGDAIHIDQ